jgi:hypothetical protein
VGRTTTAITTGAGSGTAVTFSGGKFNTTVKLQAKPPATAINCFVYFARTKGDPNPGLVSLFTLI